MESGRPHAPTGLGSELLLPHTGSSLALVHQHGLCASNQLLLHSYEPLPPLPRTRPPHPTLPLLLPPPLPLLIATSVLLLMLPYLPAHCPPSSSLSAHPPLLLLSPSATATTSLTCHHFPTCEAKVRVIPWERVGPQHVSEWGSAPCEQNRGSLRLGWTQ